MKYKFVKTFESFISDDISKKTKDIVSNLENETLFSIAGLDFDQEYIDNRDFLYAERLASEKISNKIKILISQGIDLSDINFYNGDFDDLYM